MNNFTPQAQLLLAEARKEASHYTHNFVGPEHILLGLVRLGDSNQSAHPGQYTNALKTIGLDLLNVRNQVEDYMSFVPDMKLGSGHMPYTEAAKEVLALASKTAKFLGHSYVRTEHILIALIDEGRSIAAKALGALCDVSKARETLLEAISCDKVVPISDASDASDRSEKREQSVPESTLRDIVGNIKKELAQVDEKIANLQKQLNAALAVKVGRQSQLELLNTILEKGLK